MNVITIEEEAYKNLLEEVKNLVQAAKKMSDEIFIQKHKYLTAAEVGAITGYSSKSIKNRKDEIGYITQGGELKFIRSDVDAWMRRYYISPNI